MNVTWQKYAPVGEIGGNYVQFALFKQTDVSDFVALNEHFVCKDFLADMFWYEYTKQKGSIDIYGFICKGQAEEVIYNGYQWVGIRLQEKADKNKFICISEKQENLELYLNSVEKLLNLKPTQTVIDDEGISILLKVDRCWFLKPILISLLTFLIRTGLNYDGKTDVMKFIKEYPVADNDYSYRTSAHAIIQKLSEGCICKQNFNNYNEVYEMRNSGGIVSVHGEMDKWFEEKKQAEPIKTRKKTIKSLHEESGEFKIENGFWGFANPQPINPVVWNPNDAAFDDNPPINQFQD